MKLSIQRKIAARARWICPSCNCSLATHFCPACGEAPAQPQDLTLRGFVRQVAQASTSLDGILLRSLRSLIASPGLLTLAYLQGRRKSFTPPFQLFLVSNVLFFAMQSLTGAKIFSTPLNQHLHHDIWGGIAQPMVAHHLAVRHTGLGLYAPVFDQAVALNAKSLIVAMVLPLAMLQAVVFCRSRRPFVAHVVFSLHFYSFVLFMLCVSLGIVAGSEALGGPGLESAAFDRILSVLELLACALYLYIAAKTVYETAGIARVLQILPLAAATGAIFLAYRFAVFVFTLLTT